MINVSPLLRNGGRRCRDRMVVEYTMQSVPIASNVVSSNPVKPRYARYNIM
jgi:hypothetical protein